ncbi:MAG: ATP-binding cassette domain-containing protein [Chloroflexota bacterium]
MILVEGLTKYYGDFRAINSLSFHADAGEIIGFLGPNGAGKTTTMRILTGYMPPSAGSASVAGFDVFEESLEARRRVAGATWTTWPGCTACAAPGGRIGWTRCWRWST